MKLLIDKIKLQLLLEKKRDYIRHPLEGIDILITAVIYIVSLLCSDFKPISNISSDRISTIAWGIAVLLVIYGSFKLWKSWKYKYDHEHLFHDIENLDEVLHRFSIVAVKDTFNQFSNRFLLHYDSNWNCWFFFSFPTNPEQNEESIIQRLSNQLKLPASTIRLHYITDRLQPKFSVKDNINKVYQHSLYQAWISDFLENMQKTEFTIEGVNFKWMTIEEMEKDDSIMKINHDVVSFIKEKIN
ncbi:hypothetical protein LI187_15040 [bacterium 210820-DFI.6.38]|nr:hypothetical protein [bacterium 210820-DFI.6.38]